MDRQDIILEHCTKDMEALELSLDIIDAGKQLRHQIISKAMDELKVLLREKLGKNWIVKNEISKAPGERDTRIWFWHNDWENYNIGLSPGSLNNRNYCFYVGSPQNDGKDEPEAKIDQKVTSTLSNKFGGKASNWSHWAKYSESPYRYWDNKESLLRLANGEGVKFLLKKLLLIKDTLEEVID